MFLYLSKLLPLFIYPLGFACVVLVVTLIFWRRRRWTLLGVIVALSVLWLGGNRIVSMALAQSLEWRYPPLTSPAEADVIIVLGGATRAQSYPRPINEMNEAGDRLLYASYLYQQGVAPKLLLSGGGVAFGESDRPAEAETMAKILTAMGVPPDALWLETSSRNTYENAVESLKFLNEKETESKEFERIVLVTSAFHMRRSVAIFERQGAAVIPAPTDYHVTQADWDYYLTPNYQMQLTNLIPSARDLDMTTSVIREYIGFAIYRMKGWL
jgi:uncharacterized SAM-binding protein YcdF (DUF218 family)